MQKTIRSFLGALIFLVPTRAMANAGIPMISITIPFFLICFIPVVGIETYILRKQLGVTFKRLLYSSAIANAVSTLIGVPLTWLVLVALQLLTGGGGGVPQVSPFLMKFLKVTWQAPWLLPYQGDMHWMIPIAMLVLLVPFFFTSWMVEYFIVRKLNRNVAAESVKSACLRANIASYLFLALFPLLKIANILPGLTQIL